MIRHIAGCMGLLAMISILPAQSVAPQEVKSRLEAGEDMVILDIRPAGLFAAGHLEKAKNVGFDGTALASGYQSLIPSPGTPVIVVCQDGQESAVAVKALVGAGYTGSVFIQGGMDACNSVLTITASTQNLTTWGVIKTLFGGAAYRRKST